MSLKGTYMNKRKSNASAHKIKTQDLPIENMTCFKACSALNSHCPNDSCRYWKKMENDSHHNCVILAAKDGPMTLQQVGDIFKVTRMRICQIEKIAKQYLKTLAPKNLND